MHRVLASHRVGLPCLALAATLLGSLSPALAQPLPPDPVEKLRHDLRAPADEFVAQDQELARQYEAAKPEDRPKIAAAARQRILMKDIEALKSISQMVRGLQLQEWSQDPEDTGKVRGALANRARQAVRDVLEHGSSIARQAVETLLGEIGEMIKTPEDPKGVGRALAPELAEIVEHGSTLEARASAARALGLIFPEPAVAVPALRGLLNSKDPVERRAAARGLLSLIEVVSRLAAQPVTQGRTTSRVEAGSQDVVDTARLVVPVAANRGLADPDTEVRRLSARAVRESAAALLNLVPQSRPSEAGPTTGTPGSERMDFGPLVRALADAGPAMARALRDADAEVRVNAQRALEHMGNARQRLLKAREGAQPGLLPPPDRDSQAPAGTTDVVVVSAQARPAGAPQDPLLETLRIAIPALEEDLFHPDMHVRLGAVEVLETLGPAAAPAVPALIRATNDRNLFVRWASSRTLGKIGPAAHEAATLPLAHRLFDDDLDVRLAAATALQHYGPAATPAVPEVIAALKASDAEMRMAAMRTLEAIGVGAKDAVPAVSAELSDPDVRVRKAAAEVLGRFGPLAGAAEPALRRALNDSSPEVRRAASEALLNIVGPPARR
jgi:HEAT repeat protein